MTEHQAQRPAERPGRYQRSPSGLIAALVITVLAVLAFVVFRSLNRTDLDVEPERVDYLATVQSLQQDGAAPVYPATLPLGWMATSVDVRPGDRLAWGVGILTDDDEFVGVRQSSESLDSLLETYVDEQPADDGTVSAASDVAGRWRAFHDDGGDRAYAAEVGDQTVLVFGSASDADLREVVGSLTRDRL